MLRSEFDGPTDGIVYGTAIGLGYATVLNVAFSGGGTQPLVTVADGEPTRSREPQRPNPTPRTEGNPMRGKNW